MIRWKRVPELVSRAAKGSALHGAEPDRWMEEEDLRARTEMLMLRR